MQPPRPRPPAGQDTGDKHRQRYGSREAGPCRSRTLRAAAAAASPPPGRAVREGDSRARREARPRPVPASRRRFGPARPHARPRQAEGSQESPGPSCPARLPSLVPTLALALLPCRCRTRARAHETRPQRCISAVPPRPGRSRTPRTRAGAVPGGLRGCGRGGARRARRPQGWERAVGTVPANPACPGTPAATALGSCSSAPLRSM